MAFVLRLFRGVPGWEAFSLGALGAAVGALLPRRPERLYLWAGKRLGVGEGLLAAWDLLGRGEEVLLRRLWEKLVSSLGPHWKLLLPQRSEVALLGVVLMFSLLVLVVPHPGIRLPVLTPPASQAVSPEREDKGAEEDVRALSPEPGSPPEWTGGEAPERWPEGELPPSALPPEGRPAPSPSLSEPPPEVGAGSEPSSPGESLPEAHKALSQPAVQAPAPAALVPAPGREAAAEIREARDGEGGEGQDTGEARVYRPTDGTPSPTESAPGASPFPETRRSGATGKEELGGTAEGEPPSPEDGGDLERVGPSRRTQVQMRPGEGETRTGTVLSVPPEPPGTEGAPHVPPMDAVAVHLVGRDLPLGAEELVRRYFSILSQEEVR